MAELRGVMPAMITPFDRSGALNLSVLPEFIQFQRAAGMDGLVVCGTNGEATSMSVAERKRVLEAVLTLRGDMTVVAGTGAASVTDALELTRHASSCGVDAVLVLPPFYYKNPSAAGIAAYFRRILDASDVPVLLYSIPQFTAVPVTDDILNLLIDHPRLAGLKDSQGDWNRTSALIKNWSGMKVFSGSDDLLARGLSAGSAGAISGSANCVPELIVSVKRACEGGDPEAAQERLDCVKRILLDYPLIAVAKSVLAHRGIPRMWVRPPLVDLTESQERELIARLRDAGLTL